MFSKLHFEFSKGFIKASKASYVYMGCAKYVIRALQVS